MLWIKIASLLFIYFQYIGVMMRKSYPVVIVVSAVIIIGFALTLNTSNKNDSVRTDYHEEMINLKQQQEAVLIAFDNLNSRLASIENNLATTYAQNSSSNQISGSDDDSSVFEEIQPGENMVTEEVIQETRYKIIDDLSSAIISVPQALESPELNSLPKNEQLKLVSEIIARYNSGELPR